MDDFPESLNYFGIEKAQEMEEDCYFLSRILPLAITALIQSSFVLDTIIEDRPIEDRAQRIVSALHTITVQGIFQYREWLQNERGIDIRKLEGRVE